MFDGAAKFTVGLGPIFVAIGLLPAPPPYAPAAAREVRAVGLAALQACLVFGNGNQVNGHGATPS